MQDHEWVGSIGVPFGGAYSVVDARTALETMSRLFRRPVQALAESLTADWEEGDEKKHRDFILSAADLYSDDERIGTVAEARLSTLDDAVSFRGFDADDIFPAINTLKYCSGMMDGDDVIEALAENDPTAERWMNDVWQERYREEGLRPVYELRQFDVLQGVPNGDWKPSKHLALMYTRYAGSAKDVDDANQLVKDVCQTFEYLGAARQSESNPRLPVVKMPFPESVYTNSFNSILFLSQDERDAALNVVHRMHTTALEIETQSFQDNQPCIDPVIDAGREALQDSVPRISARAVKLAMLAIDPTLHRGKDGLVVDQDRAKGPIHEMAVDATDVLIDRLVVRGVSEVPLGALADDEDKRISIRQSDIAR